MGNVVRQELLAVSLQRQFTVINNLLAQARETDLEVRLTPNRARDSVEITGGFHVKCTAVLGGDAV